MSGSVPRKRDVIRRSEFSNKTQTLVHQDFNISQIDGKIKRFSKCENVNNIVKKPVYYTKNNRFKLLKRKTYLKNTYYIFTITLCDINISTQAKVYKPLTRSV